MKTLVVDDDPVSQVALQDLLISSGVSNIQSFGDGEACWQYLQTEPEPLLCCCDVRMPKLGGIDLLSRVRQHPRHKNLAFVLITSGAERNLVESAIKLGIAGYIVKPFEAVSVGERLIDITTRALSRFAEPPHDTARRLRINNQKLLLYYQAYDKQIERFIDLNISDLSTEYKIGLDALKTGALTLGLHYAGAQIDALNKDNSPAYRAPTFLESVQQLLYYQACQLVTQ